MAVHDSPVPPISNIPKYLAIVCLPFFQAPTRLMFFPFKVLISVTHIIESVNLIDSFLYILKDTVESRGCKRISQGKPPVCFTVLWFWEDVKAGTRKCWRSLVASSNFYVAYSVRPC